MVASKPKVKSIPFDNKATEVLPQTWEWKVGSITWRWKNQPGFNFGPVNSQGQWESQLYMKNLETAAYYSEGFHGGRAYAENLRKAAAPQDTSDEDE